MSPPVRLALQYVYAATSSSDCALCRSSTKSAYDRLNRLLLPLGVPGEHERHALGLPVRQRLQHLDVDHAEDGGVRADAQRQRRDCGRREARRPAQDAHAVAKILNQRSHRSHLRRAGGSSKTDTTRRGTDLLAVIRGDRGGRRAASRPRAKAIRGSTLRRDRRQSPRRDPAGGGRAAAARPGAAARVTASPGAASEAARHPRERVVGSPQQLGAGRLQGVVPLPLAASLRRGIAEPGGHEAAALQAVERGVDRARRHHPPRPRLDRLPDARAVRILVEVQQREEEQLLELAQVGSHRRSVGNIRRSVAQKLRSVDLSEIPAFARLSISARFGAASP